MERNLELFSGRYPREYLPIGEDAGGSLVLIKLTRDDYGSIHFWNHEEESDEDEPQTHSNITRISDSFAAYLEELEPCELPDEDSAWVDEYRRAHGLDT